MVPELVGKLTGLGYDVVVEPGAGEGALHSDQEYADAGATVAEEPWDGAERRRLGATRSTPTCCAGCRPAPRPCRSSPRTTHLDLVADLRDLGLTAFAMELVPRISRAQSMDALSSQALVAGYRCAIVAAGLLRRFFPLNMTAAGTVPPAEVVVLGAGVAGLQAIATCRSGSARWSRRTTSAPPPPRRSARWAPRRSSSSSRRWRAPAATPAR